MVSRPGLVEARLGEERGGCGVLASFAVLNSISSGWRVKGTRGVCRVEMGGCRWAHKLAHAAGDAGCTSASKKLHAAQVLLAEARSLLDEAKTCAEEGATVASGATAKRV